MEGKHLEAEMVEAVNNSESGNHPYLRTHTRPVGKPMFTSSPASLSQAYKGSINDLDFTFSSSKRSTHRISRRGRHELHMRMPLVAAIIGAFEWAHLLAAVPCALSFLFHLQKRLQCTASEKLHVHLGHLYTHVHTSHKYM